MMTKQTQKSKKQQAKKQKSKIRRTKKEAYTRQKERAMMRLQENIIHNTLKQLDRQFELYERGEGKFPEYMTEEDTQFTVDSTVFNISPDGMSVNIVGIGKLPLAEKYTHPKPDRATISKDADGWIVEFQVDA